jgi:hypothetical protein
METGKKLMSVEGSSGSCLVKMGRNAANLDGIVISGNTKCK